MTKLSINCSEQDGVDLTSQQSVIIVNYNHIYVCGSAKINRNLVEYHVNLYREHYIDDVLLVPEYFWKTKSFPTALEEGSEKLSSKDKFKLIQLIPSIIETELNKNENFKKFHHIAYLKSNIYQTQENIDICQSKIRQIHKQVVDLEHKLLNLNKDLKSKQKE